MKHLLDYIRMGFGIFLLLFVILFWILGIIFGSIVSIVTWFEKKVANAMKKCMGEEEL